MCAQYLCEIALTQALFADLTNSEHLPAGLPEAILADQIKELRRRLGVTIPGAEKELSQAALARILTDRLQREPPLNSSTVSRWEKQEGTPDPWALVELARLARTSVEVFLYPAAPDAQLPPEVAEEVWPPPKS